MSKVIMGWLLYTEEKLKLRSWWLCSSVLGAPTPGLCIIWLTTSACVQGLAVRGLVLSLPCCPLSVLPGCACILCPGWTSDLMMNVVEGDLLPSDYPYNMQHKVLGWLVYKQSLNSQLCRTSHPKRAFLCLHEAHQVLWAKASIAWCPLPDCSLSVLPLNMITAANILYGGCHHSRHWGITKALISLLAWPCRPSHPSIK